MNKVHGQPELTPLISGEIDQPYREIEYYRPTNWYSWNWLVTRLVLVVQEHLSTLKVTQDREHTSLLVLLPQIQHSNSTSLTFVCLLHLQCLVHQVLNATQGAKITGVNSGAHGYVASASSGTALVLTSVVGTFTPGEKVTSTSSTESDEILENSSNADLTISSITVNDFSAVKQVHMNDPDTGDADFSGDVVLSNNITLGWTCNIWWFWYNSQRFPN